MAEDDVADQHAFDFDAPAVGDLGDDVPDVLCDLLAAFNHVLQDTRANDMPQGGLGPLNQRLSDVGNAECGFVRGDDTVVDDRCEVEGNVVFGDARLLWDLLRQSPSEWKVIKDEDSRCTYQRFASSHRWQAESPTAD